ncbi:MAG: hypothetical protein ACRCXT_14030 [Paraclostridium sp.]
MMKFKIITLILICMITLSGCSMNNKFTEVDKATQQKNITKVQNNVNEVMGKDYSYVRYNLGKPYATTFYVDLDNYSDINDIEISKFKEELDAQLVYPKEGYESSALYIQLENNEVIGVRSDIFVGNTNTLNNVPQHATNSDMIIDLYDKEIRIDEEQIDLENINEYIGKEINSIKDEFENINPNATAYNKNNEKTVDFYLLKSKLNENKVLSITKRDKVIINTSIQKESNEIIKSILKEVK